MKKKYLMSILEKLLLAAYELEKKGKSPFSAEDLVVSAWKKFPDAFGLSGYHDDDGQLSFPDSNRVFAEIMGSKPIRKRGLLVKVGKKMYQLTEAGREHTKLLLNRPVNYQIKKAGLAREVQQEILRLLESKAFDKYKKGLEKDITFFDACAFWRISPRSSAIELYGRIAHFHKMLETFNNTIHDREVTFNHRGHIFNSKDLDILDEVNSKLEKIFHKEIDIIKSRKDERVL